MMTVFAPIDASPPSIRFHAITPWQRSSSAAFPRAALIPPSAAPEWLRTGWILEINATSAPVSCASIAARMPAQPAPTTSTSCFASTSRNLSDEAQPPFVLRRYSADRGSVLRIDRHRLGPRVYVLGARVHEWHLGAVLLLGLAAGAAFHHVGDGTGTGVAFAAGIWLVLKDWRDLHPAHRDTTSWRLGLHVPVHPLRAVRRADPLPKLAALTAGLAGLVNLASAVTPNIAWRDHLLLQIAPLETLQLSHAAAVPASLLLLVTAPYLWRRRQGALQLALSLLLGLAILDVVKGLDVEPAAGSAAAAAVLWIGRRSFYVRHDPVTLRSALRRVPLLGAAGLVLCWLAARVASPENASL